MLLIGDTMGVRRSTVDTAAGGDGCWVPGSVVFVEIFVGLKRVAAAASRSIVDVLVEEDDDDDKDELIGLDGDDEDDEDETPAVICCGVLWPLLLLCGRDEAGVGDGDDDAPQCIIMLDII